MPNNVWMTACHINITRGHVQMPHFLLTPLMEFSFNAVVYVFLLCMRAGTVVSETAPLSLLSYCLFCLALIAQQWCAGTVCSKRKKRSVQASHTNERRHCIIFD